MKHFNTTAIANLTSNFFLQSGKYIGMFVIFRGVNQAGQTLANSDCGIITILKNGVQKVNVDFDILQQSHNALEHGAVANVSAAGLAFHISAFVPFTLPNDETALDIQGNNEWQCVHNFPGATPVLVASGDVFYYGVKADDVDVSPYEVQLVNQHNNISGAGVHIFNIYQENVHSIYIEKDAALDYVTLLKDGIPFYDQIHVADINVESNLLTKTETYNGTLPYLKLLLNPNNEDSGSFAKEIQMQLTATAACVVKALIVSQFTTPDRFARSIANRNVVIEKKVLSKPTAPQSVKSTIITKKLQVGS